MTARNTPEPVDNVSIKSGMPIELRTASAGAKATPAMNTTVPTMLQNAI